MKKENKRRSLGQWYERGLTGAIKVWKMQDRYLSMKTGQLFDYLRKNYAYISDMIPNEDIENEEVGKVIQCAADRLELALDLRDFEAAQTEYNILFALLVLPFACWITDTEYIPELRFLEKTDFLN